jgi:hypothetical protein
LLLWKALRIAANLVLWLCLQRGHLKMTKKLAIYTFVLAIAVTASVEAIPAVRGAYLAHRTKVLYQAAIASKFPGYVQIETEKLSWAPDTAGNVAIHNTRVHTVLPDGSDSVVTHELGSGKLFRRLWMPHANPPQQITAQDHINAKTSIRISSSSPVDALLLQGDPTKECLVTFGGYPTLPGSTTKGGHEILYIRNSAGDLIAYPAVKAVSSPSDRRVTVWFLPTAGCVKAKTLWEYFPVPGKSSNCSTSVVETTQLDVGPPANPVVAFSVPDSDQEMSPTAAIRANIKWGIWQRADLDEAGKQALWNAKQNFQPMGAADIGYENSYQAHKVQ